MAPVMRKHSEHTPPVQTPDTDKQSWEQLYDRIRVLTLMRSAVMLDEPADEAEAFDRGARSLRTLMGAAEISRRMKQEDAKEQGLNDEKTRTPVTSDEGINEVYRAVEQSVERIEREAREAHGDRGGAAPVSSGTGGQTVEDQRS
jgi:hypothetical protein